MADFPNPVTLPLVIGCASEYGYGMIAAPWIATGTGSGTWPTGDLAIFAPLALPAPYTVRALWCYNGSAVAGNVDLGIYGLDGTKIISKGATAQAGTSQLQILTVTETTIPAGRYLLGMSASSTSATTIRASFSVVNLQALGIVQAASQMPLANLPTFATPANTYLPTMGIASVTTF